jgi:hypothetical protein
LECTGHTSLLRSSVVKSDCRSYLLPPMYANRNERVCECVCVGHTGITVALGSPWTSLSSVRVHPHRSYLQTWSGPTSFRRMRIVRLFRRRRRAQPVRYPSHESLHRCIIDCQSSSMRACKALAPLPSRAVTKGSLRSISQYLVPATIHGPYSYF